MCSIFFFLSLSSSEYNVILMLTDTTLDEVRYLVQAEVQISSLWLLFSSPFLFFFFSLFYHSFSFGRDKTIFLFPEKMSGVDFKARLHDYGTRCISEHSISFRLIIFIFFHSNHHSHSHGCTRTHILFFFCISSCKDKDIIEKRKKKKEIIIIYN